MINLFEQFVYKRKELDITWIKGDESTWNIIVPDYRDTIEPAIKFLQERGVIGKAGAIQAGGHCGLYAYLMTSQFDMIFTFEPNPVNFHCLVNNCQGKNIVKFNAALGSKAGRVESKIISSNNMGMCTVEETTDKYYIPMMKIDSLELTGIDLIEFDLEGFEYEALLGAKETIERNKPAIIVENATDEITQFLDALGYVIWKKINRLDSVFVLKKDLEKLNDS